MKCRQLRPAEFPDALNIRLKVFVDEQHVPLAEERDSHDDEATHFGCFVGGTMVGTARLLITGSSGQIGRMAVLQHYRKQGVGKQLLQTIIDHARQVGLTELCLHSQTHAIPFYRALGFVAHGDVFDDAGLPHRTMSLSLQKTTV